MKYYIYSLYLVCYYAFKYSPSLTLKFVCCTTQYLRKYG